MLSPSDRDLVLRDPALPGLATVLDPPAMVEALRRFRPDLDADGAAITYLRYKPHTSCLVGYRLRLQGEDLLLGVQARHPVTDHKLAKVWDKPGIAGPLGAGRLVLPELAIAVSVFPNDRRLPHLKRLANPDKVRSLLRELGAAKRRVRHSRLELLRYRPERRCVAQLVGDHGPVAIVKFHGKADYALACASVAAFKSSGALRVPEPIACSSRFRAVASEWLTGGVPEPTVDLARHIGEALWKLHQQTPTGLPELSRERQARGIRELSRDLSALWPPLARRCRAMARRLSMELLQQQAPSRAIHGDFYIDQVVAGKGRIGIVDFDEVAWGSPSWDLGDFIGHLHYRALFDAAGGDEPEAVGEALLEGYHRSGGQAPAREVALQTAVALMRLAPRPFRQRDPRWPEKIETLLDKVDSILGPATPVAPAVSRGAKARDPAMPLLDRALDPEEAQRHFDLQPLGPGDWRVEQARLARHKPGRRALIEYGVKRGGETRVLFGKMRARGADERTFSVYRRLWTAEFGPGARDAIRIPEPISVAPSLGMWLQRKVPGRSLGHMLDDSILCDPGRAAAAIAKLHHAEPPTARRHALSDELRILGERLSALAERRPSWKARLGQVMAGAGSVAARATLARPRAIHRDFYHEHLLVEDDKWYIIDLDLFCSGDAAVDIGNFSAHLVEHSLRVHQNPDRLLDWQRAFEQAYRRLVADVSAVNIRIYELLSLVRLVAIGDRMTERQPFTESLLEYCEGRLRAEIADGRVGHDSKFSA